MHLSVHSSIIYSSHNMEAATCPSRDEWIKKMWYIYTVEYYPAIEKDEIMSFVANTSELKDYHTK